MSKNVQFTVVKEDRRSNDSSGSGGGRTHSAGSMMQPLSFNRVHEDSAHPLSSLRSCSEFGLNGTHTIRRGEQNGLTPERKSLWSRILNWGSTTEEEDNQDDLQVYDPRDSARSISASSRTSIFQQKLHPKKKRKRTPTVTDEISTTLDFLFGLNPNKNIPREIELKDLKDPSAVAQLAILREPTIYPDLPIRRTVSARSLNRLTISSSDSSSPRNSESSASQTPANILFNPYSLADWITYLSYVTAPYFSPYISRVRTYCLEGDNELFYLLHHQPFSAGIYLRGMLAAGLNNTLFHTYTLATLSLSSLPSSSLSPSLYIYANVAYILLVIHVILNFLSAPTRGILLCYCWQTTRSISSETASQSLQTLIESDVWIINRILVALLDVICLITLFFGQIYLMTSSASLVDSSLSLSLSHETLTSLIISMCSTNMLSLLIRAVVAIIYFYSFIDTSLTAQPTLKQRTGLSNLDLDRMSTFVYTNKDEVENEECSICLSSFDMGDMVISLPCHHRHSFHANCIRLWLKRMNVCPLCQKSC